MKSYAVFRDEEKVIVTRRVGDWKLAMWINHVKNPRFRLLELPDLDIYINLPKSFALANAAIRLLHQTVNPLYRSKNAYMPLGGVFVIDVLGIPLESKVVKQWTLENCTTSSPLYSVWYLKEITFHSSCQILRFSQPCTVSLYKVQSYMPVFEIYRTFPASANVSVDDVEKELV